MALVNATRSRFLARQPILTADKFVFAYEILSRSSAENYCIFGPGESPHFKAMDELFVMGMKKMTHGLPAFLNCTREFLLHDYIELLPRESVVGEILETVEPDSEALDACRRLKARGYRFALDDYEDRSSLEPFSKSPILSKSIFNHQPGRAATPWRKIPSSLHSSHRRAC